MKTLEHTEIRKKIEEVATDVLKEVNKVNSDEELRNLILDKLEMKRDRDVYNIASLFMMEIIMGLAEEKDDKRRLQ